MRVLLFLLVVFSFKGTLTSSSSPSLSSETCSSLSKSSGLPCVTVSSCSGGTPPVELSINKLSSGSSSPSANSRVYVCHENEGLLIRHEAYGQTITNPSSPYTTCNSGIFNLDVVEAFVTSTSLHCYSEIDLSPFNVPYESGIYNPNLTHTNLQHSLLDCDTSGVKHESVLSTRNSTWISTMSIPWEKINCPSGCPESLNTKKESQKKPSYCSGKPPKGIVRANFFRVVEKSLTDMCNSQLCDYLAWSPTFVDPPSFHEPNYFGYLILS